MAIMRVKICLCLFFGRNTKGDGTMPLDMEDKEKTEDPTQGSHPSRFSGKRSQLKSEAGRLWQTALAHLEIWTHKKRKRFSQTYASYLIGQYLYEVGFRAEYDVVRIWRTTKSAAQMLFHAAAWAGMRLAKQCKRVLLELGEDIAGPIVGVFKGFKGLRHTAKSKYQEEGATTAAKHSAVYLGTGLLKYLRVLGRAASYALPVAGLFLFVSVVQEKMSETYALAVECNGQVVGYVEDELVFDEAKDKVKSRIVLAQDQQWDVDPTFTLATAQEVMDVNATADAILMASSDQIQEATGLEVDGQLVAITDGTQQLQDYLAQRKAEYEDPNNPNLRVEFVQSVQTVDGLYASETVQDVSQVIEMLSGLKEQQQDYAIQAGDSLTLVASRFDLTSAQLKELNPKLNDSSYNWPIGDTLVVHQEVPYLQIKTIETVTTEEVIEFTTTKQDDNELAYGKTVTDQEGQDGLDQVTYEYIRVNGILTEVTEISRVCLKEPVTEIIRRGTKMPEGSESSTAVFGTGTLLWPVPGYTSVTRWMSSGHKGADLAAPYGTPILAADSGVVIKAGWNAAGSGYGYSIVIQHSPGNTTLYAHCSSLAVSVGQSVSKGQVIGYVGSTGWSTGNHLHFEIYKNGTLVSARNYFPNK